MRALLSPLCAFRYVVVTDDHCIFIINSVPAFVYLMALPTSKVFDIPMSILVLFGADVSFGPEAHCQLIQTLLEVFGAQRPVTLVGMRDPIYISDQLHKQDRTLIYSCLALEAPHGPFDDVLYKAALGALDDNGDAPLLVATGTKINSGAGNVRS